MEPRNTAEFIGELNAGVFANQIGHVLSKVASGAVSKDNAGSVTLPFTR